ncbi:MAG: hypothetical protein QXZ44_00395 [Ferroplasma sp.]
MVINGYVILIIALIDGLLFGLAIKKALVSIILVIIALVLAAYAGLSFVPKVSASAILSDIESYMADNITKIPGLLHLGGIGSLTLVSVLFIVGLGLGIWKG